MFVCSACLGKTFPDYLAAVNDLRHSFKRLLDSSVLQDNFIPEKLLGMEKGLSELGTRTTAIETKSDTILRGLGETRVRLSNLCPNPTLVTRVLFQHCKVQTEDDLLLNAPKNPATPGGKEHQQSSPDMMSIVEGQDPSHDKADKASTEDKVEESMEAKRRN